MRTFDLTEDQAISFITIACDFGVTQVGESQYVQQSASRSRRDIPRIDALRPGGVVGRCASLAAPQLPIAALLNPSLPTGPPTPCLQSTATLVFMQSAPRSRLATQ